MGDDVTVLNGIRIRRGKRREVLVDQLEKIEKFETTNTDKVFASQRSMQQYVGLNL